MLGISVELSFNRIKFPLVLPIVTGLIRKQSE